MKRWTDLVAAAGCVVAAAVFGWLAVRQEGRLDYDGAVYLERGLYHAEQVAARGGPVLLRLPWSLLFEAPKPPLYHGILAAAALALGREQALAVLFTGLFLPLLALLLGVYLTLREAATRRAGAIGLALCLAMPAVQHASGRVMVEASLAACVTWAGFFAVRVMSGEVRARDALGLGGALGLAALTKLTGLVFVGGLLVLAAGAVGSRQGLVPALRLTLAASSTALLVALPWYLRNGEAAVAFGRIAADSFAHWDVGSPWSRPFRLVETALGLPLAVTLGACALETGRCWRVRPRAQRDLAVVALTAAVAGGLVVVMPRQFDPRFWMPCLGLVACWAAPEIDRWAGSRARSIGVALSLGALVGVATVRQETAPATPTAWTLRSLLDERGAEAAPGSLLCNLGETPGWNRYKIRLMAQMSSVRPRLEVVDLLHEVAPEALERTLDRCELLFLLDPGEVPDERSQIVHNRGLESIRARWLAIAGAGSWVRDGSAEARLGAPFRVEVWRRSGALPPNGEGA